ncbi:hypothetical protein [Butyrivibrio sp. XPD2006]|uniref:hypothetical protein n=1 Tax=Butyrivibrio sp. XPD2006 TaxID=1280668 RepID=UPI0003B69062|nr:hypothetical protein [Butyrivibrio sp. XPD2006]
MKNEGYSNFIDVVITFFIVTFVRFIITPHGLPVASGCDQVSLISPAAFLAGYDWRDVVTTAGYYGIGVSWLLAPFYYLGLKSIHIYWLLGFLSDLLFGLCACVYYCIIAKFTNINNRVNRVAIAVIVSSTALSSNYSAVAGTNEVMLDFIGAIICYMLFVMLCCPQGKKTKYEIVLLMIFAYMYTVHTRAVIYLLAFALLSIALWFSHKEQLVHRWFWYLSVIEYFSVQILLKYYQSFIWVGTARNSSIAATLSGKLTASDYFLRIKVMFMIVISTLINHYSLTLGVGFIAIVTFCILIYKIVKNHENIYMTTEFFVGLYFFFAYIVCLAGMAYIWSKGAADGISSGANYVTQYRAFYYPRYAGTFIPGMVLMAILIIYNNHYLRKKAVLISSLSIIVMSIYYLQKVVPFIDNKRIRFFLIHAIQDKGVKADHMLWTASIQFIIFIAIVWGMTFFLSNRKYLDILAGVMLVYVNFLLWNMYFNDNHLTEIKYYSYANSGYELLCSISNEIDNPDIYVIDIRNKSSDEIWHMYQFMNYSMHIVPGLPPDGIDNCILFSNGIIKSHFLNNYSYIQLDDNEYVYYCGNEYARIIESVLK